jgi:hypothetical protein
MGMRRERSGEDGKDANANEKMEKWRSGEDGEDGEDGDGDGDSNQKITMMGWRIGEAEGVIGIRNRRRWKR